MLIARGQVAAYDTSVLDPDADLPPIEAVLFDFASTLFRPITTRTWLVRALASHGVTPDESALEGYEKALATAWQLPEVEAAQVGRDTSPTAHRAAGLAWLTAVPELRPYAETLYEGVTAADSYVPYTDAEPVLRELAARQVPVGVVSDIAWDATRHFKHYGLHELISCFVFSYEENTEKPDPALFGLACQRLGVEPRRTLMVGDNPARDGGAIRLGLRAYILPAEPRTGARGLDAVLRLLG